MNSYRTKYMEMSPESKREEKRKLAGQREREERIGLQKWEGEEVTALGSLSKTNPLLGLIKGGRTAVLNFQELQAGGGEAEFGDFSLGPVAGKTLHSGEFHLIHCHGISLFPLFLSFLLMSCKKVAMRILVLGRTSGQLSLCGFTTVSVTIEGKRTADSPYMLGSLAAKQSCSFHREKESQNTCELSDSLTY